MKDDRIRSGYFLLQGVLGAIWWVALFIFPSIRGYFLPEFFPEQVLWSLAWPDIALFVGGSLLAAWTVATNAKFASAACWFVTGATGYATLMCYGWTSSTGDAWTGAIAMTAALVGTTLFAVGYSTDTSVAS